MEIAFRRYRTMSFITGTTLLLLLVVFILHHTLSKQTWQDNGLDVVDRVVGIGHGVVLYPIYLYFCFRLTLKARLPVLQLAAMMLAGFVPGLAFVMERWVANRLGFGISAAKES